jgi:hypothetical protein
LARTTRSFTEPSDPALNAPVGNVGFGADSQSDDATLAQNGNAMISVASALRGHFFI